VPPRHQLHGRGETPEQRCGVGLGEEGHLRMAADASRRKGRASARSPKPQSSRASRRGRGSRVGFAKHAELSSLCSPMTSNQRFARAVSCRWRSVRWRDSRSFSFSATPPGVTLRRIRLFYWWGFQWTNPTSEAEHGWLILGLSCWLVLAECAAGAGGAQSGDARGGIRRHARRPGGAPARLYRAANPHLHHRLPPVHVGLLALAGGRRWGRAAVFRWVHGLCPSR
jgi:hypothetical protein